MSLRSKTIRLAHSLPAGSDRTAVLNVLASLPSGTVEMFLMVLTSKLTQFDKRLERKQPNTYRLGHYLKAANKVKSTVRKYTDRDDAEALNALKKSLLREFTTSLNGKPDLPPVRNVFKQIDAFLASGKLPSLRG